MTDGLPSCRYCGVFCANPVERAAHIRRLHGIEAQVAQRAQRTAWLHYMRQVVTLSVVVGLLLLLCWLVGA